MDAICLIAAPRTGTRHLSEVLKNAPDLASYLDVFDPASGNSGIEASVWPLLRKLSGVDFDTIRNPALAAFVREKPTQWLDALEQAAAFQGKRQFSFRLLSGQLDNEVIARELMPRQGLRAIVVMRKQIDAYVSLRKGTQLGKWQDVDTTGMIINIDAAPMVHWLDEQERWYDMWRNDLNRRFMPCPIVRYELDIDQPPERVIRRFAAAAAQIGVTVRTPATIENKGLMKQDRAPKVADKVTNWAEFSKDIFALGIERRAFGYPI